MRSFFQNCPLNANTDRINDASLQFAMKQTDKPSPAVPFINSQALRRNHASKRTASRAPSLNASNPIQAKTHFSSKHVSESEVEDSHDLRTRPRTAPSEAQRRIAARRRALCSNNLLLLSSSAQIVSGSRSTTQSSNLANSTRRGINMAAADSFSGSEIVSRTGYPQPLHSSGTESRFVLASSLFCEFTFTFMNQPNPFFLVCV